MGHLDPPTPLKKQADDPAPFTCLYLNRDDLNRGDPGGQKCTYTLSQKKNFPENETRNIIKSKIHAILYDQGSYELT